MLSPLATGVTWRNCTAGVPVPSEIPCPGRKAPQSWGFSWSGFYFANENVSLSHTSGQRRISKAGATCRSEGSFHSLGSAITCPPTLADQALSRRGAAPTQGPSLPSRRALPTETALTKGLQHPTMGCPTQGQCPGDPFRAQHNRTLPNSARPQPDLSSHPHLTSYPPLHGASYLGPVPRTWAEDAGSEVLHQNIRTQQSTPVCAIKWRTRLQKSTCSRMTCLETETSRSERAGPLPSSASTELSPKRWAPAAPVSADRS